MDIWHPPPDVVGFSGGSDSKESSGSAGDSGSIPGSGQSPGEGNVSSDSESISVKISARPQRSLFFKVLTESAQFDIISVWSKGYRACLKNRDI